MTKVEAEDIINSYMYLMEKFYNHKSDYSLAWEQGKGFTLSSINSTITSVVSLTAINSDIDMYLEHLRKKKIL